MTQAAVTGSSSVFENSSTAEQTQSLTVPGDAEAIVVMAIGYSTGNLWPATTMAFAGDSLTLQTGSNYTGAGSLVAAADATGHTAIWTGLASSWGSSEDLVWNWGASVSEGVAICAFFLTDVNSGDFIEDSETAASADSNITGLSAPTDSITLGCAYSAFSTPDLGAGATSLGSGIFNTAGYRFSSEDESTAWESGNYNFSRTSAIVINGATAGSTITGSGTPASQASTASGSGDRGATGTGTPAAQVATVSGDGGLVFDGTGVLAAQLSTVAGSGTIVVPLQIALTAANDYELRDEDGAVVASLSNISYEFYDDDGSTSGTPIDSGTFGTNASGEATIVLSNSTLTDGQFGTLVLFHPSDTSIRGVYRVAVSGS